MFLFLLFIASSLIWLSDIPLFILEISAGFTSYIVPIIPFFHLDLVTTAI
jgi:hypothetical protein